MTLSASFASLEQRGDRCRHRRGRLGQDASQLAIRDLVAEPVRAEQHNVAYLQCLLKQVGLYRGTMSQGASHHILVDVVSRFFLGQRAGRHLLGDPRRPPPTWVAEQVTAGALTQEEARNHIYKNVVTRCLGHRPTVQTDLFEQALEVGDIVLLCSDGLSNQVTDGELAGILTESATAMPAAVATLLKLANERGAPDNITAVAFQVLALPVGWEQGEPTVPARAGAASEQVTMVVPAKTSGRTCSVAVSRSRGHRSSATRR